MKLYVDTNVYLDYFLDRNKSEPAFKLFNDTISCKHKIILSEQVLFELNNYLDLSKTQMLFALLKPKLINVKANKLDFEEAKKINTHFADALHIVLAKKAGADRVITRNIKDFHSFKADRPEDL